MPVEHHIPSPCFVIEENLLRNNLEILRAVKDRAGIDILLAFKGYALWHTFPLIREYLDGASASSVNEARLCFEEMGILALKAMAWRPWEEGEERTNTKTWYEALPGPEAANQGLRFTLSHPVTAAIPPGHKDLFSMALKLAQDFKPMAEKEIVQIKEKAMNTNPLFRYPMQT